MYQKTYAGNRIKITNNGKSTSENIFYPFYEKDIEKGK